MIRIATFIVFFSLAACSPGQTYRSESGRYSIRFPGMPQVESENVNTPVGRFDTQTSFVVDRGVRFESEFIDLPGDMVKRAGVKALLQGQQQLEASEKKAKIIDVQWDEDVRGMRFLYLVDEGDSSSHYYLMRNNRFYRMSVVGPVAEIKSERAQQFFNSMTVAE